MTDREASLLFILHGKKNWQIFSEDVYVFLAIFNWN